MVGLESTSFSLWGWPAYFNCFTSFAVWTSLMSSLNSAGCTDYEFWEHISDTDSVALATFNEIDIALFG